MEPTSRKGQALLAYLSLSPRGARRDELAELLWGPGRLANLRQELYALRKLAGAETWLEENGDTVTVRAVTDVARFEQAATGGTFSVDLRAGSELLSPLSSLAAPAFRDWLDEERLRLTDLARTAHREGAALHEAEGRFAEALALVDTALAADPLDEDLHRTAIRLTALQGDRPGALARFERCRSELRRELGVEPSDETVALVTSLQAVAQRPGTPSPAVLEGDGAALAQALALGDGLLDIETLAGVLDRRPLDVAADLADLERQGWLDRHLVLKPLLAQSVADTAPAGVKRLLHHRIAQALGGRDDVEPRTLAGHLLSAGRPAAAAPLLLEAGEAAVGRNAPAEAVPLLLRASWAGWEDPSLRLRACLLLEGCASQLSDEALQDDALTESERLAWELQSDVDLAEVRMRRSRSLLRRGQVGEGMERALEALEIATRLGDPRLVARARNAVGGAQFYAGDLDGAEETFGANGEAADPVERYRALNNLGSIAGIRGRLREALHHLEAALTQARATGQQGDVIGTLNNLAATAERVGDYRRAIRYFRESLALARTSGSVGLEGQVLVNLSVVYARLGELGPAWNTASEVADIAGQLGDRRLGMRAHEQLAEVAFICGGDALALGELDVAVAIADDLGDERKTMALAAQRAVIMARHAPDSLDDAAAAVAAISSSRWADVAPWLWLELAMITPDPARVRAWIDSAGELGGDNDHLKKLTALAHLRLSLLTGAEAEAAEAAATEAAAAAHRLLLDELVAPGDSPTFGFVQEPHATLLASLLETQAGAQGAADGTPVVDEKVFDRVVAQVAEQSAGLPRSLAASRRLLPRAWLAEL